MKTQTISHKRAQRTQRKKATQEVSSENACRKSESDQPERLLTRLELARALHVGSATVDRMIAAKSIPILRFRKVVRFRLADVVKALAVPDENFEQKVTETEELRK